MSVMPPITLGDVSVRPVVEIPRSSFATTSMLPDSTADAVARHHRWLRPHFWDEGTNDLGSRIQSFVVKTPRTTVLIDTCVGNDKNREGSALWHMRRGAFLDDLAGAGRSEEHTSELQSRGHLVCRLLLEKKNKNKTQDCASKLKL